MATSIEVLRPFRPLMEEQGYRYSRGVYLLPLTDDAVGFVGFNHARRGYPPDTASLIPTIGVQYRQVLELLVRAGFGPSNSNAPTILTQLQALMSSTEWTFLEVSLSNPSSHRDVVELVQEYGLPFLHDHATLEAGWVAAKDRLGHYLHFSSPVFEFLLGNKGEAVRSLETLIAGVEGQHGMWPEQVREIGRNLIAIMREGA